jgi:polyisoprenoid-binding protein YceI
MTTFKSIATAALLGTLILGSSFTGKLSSSLKVNPSKTTMKWFATKVTGKHNGTVQIANGVLKTDGKQVNGGSFDIDMTTLVVSDVTNPDMNAKLLGHLKSDDFFSVEKHKTAHLEITKVTPKTGNEYEVTGKMTIKGITQDITFPATIVNSGKEVKATAKITLDRTRWDVRYGSGKFFEGLGDKIIHDDFIIEVNLEAGA